MGAEQVRVDVAETSCLGGLGHGPVWHPFLDLSNFFRTLCHWCNLCLVSHIGNSDDTAIVGCNNTSHAGLETPFAH